MGPVVFTLTEEGEKQAVLSGQRILLKEKYLQDIKQLRKEASSNIREQLSELRNKYITNFVKYSPEIANLNLVEFVDTLFYEFDRNTCVVKDLLDARKECLKCLVYEYNAKHLSKESMESLLYLLGADKELKEELGIAELGKKFEDKISLFDAKIVNRRVQNSLLNIAINDIADTFDPEGALFMQDLNDIKWAKSFDSTDRRNYVYDILSKAIEFKNGEHEDSYFANAINKQLSKVNPFELAMYKGNHTYLDMRFAEKKEVMVRVPQSIEEYSRYGAQYEYRDESVVEAYNPEYVKKNMPKQVKMLEDSNGYYLEIKSSDITIENLERFLKIYEPSTEIRL